MNNIITKLSFVIFLITVINLSVYAQCNHQIKLFDTYGDGWDGGATVTVKVNGVNVLTNITLASGSGPATFNFSASNGDAIQVLFTNPGASPSECYFDVLDVNGTLLVNDWYPNSSGTWNGVANCVVIMKVPTSGNNSYTTCSGNLYDNGGPSGNYSNSWNGYTVLYPVSGTDKIRISGTSSGEACCDYVKIYDGVGTGGTVLGTYYMNTAIPTLTSTVASGALTVQFYSDGSTTGAGFNIAISCFTPCATVAGTSSSSITNSCMATNTTLSLSGEGAGSIQWQKSTDGGTTWVNIAGATTDPYIFAATVNTLFRAAVTNGCTSYSTTSSITFSCDINHPASGFASTAINCGSSYTYRDPGNTGNYGDNQNGLITICPSSVGQYVNVNFTSFNTESGLDNFYVFDGDNAGAPILGIYSGNGALSGNVKATASNPSGCLSFRFYSDGGTTYAGWTATVTCSGTPSATVPSNNPEDCQGAYVICNDGTFQGGTNSYGYNELPDLWNSCLGNAGTRGEYESTWVVFSPATSGTIGFSITPTSAADYDWAIWGPYPSLECPAFNNDIPIRCSSTSLDNTGGVGTTGLIAPATDVIEQNGEYGGGTNENGILKPLDVIAGEIYVMMLDNWDANLTTFQLDWTLTNGATLDCTPPLPISLSSFNNTCKNGNTLLEFTTASEVNNDYFAIERSDQDFKFYEIGRIQGAGNSNISNNYTFLDPTFNNNTSYYRIKQVDYNGEFRYHRIVASNCYKNEFEVVNHQLTGDKLDLTVNSNENENVIIYLYDLQGRLIIEYSYQLTQGNNKINLNHIHIESGIYLINIVGEAHHYQTKLIRK